MRFLNTLFGKRKDHSKDANPDDQNAPDDVINELKQSGVYDEISSISKFEKQNQRKKKEEWIIEWSEAVLSNEDMCKLRDALKTAPIISKARILDEKKQVKDYMEGSLEQVLNRLIDYMQEDSKRPEFMAFRANWVDNEYVNVPTWLRRPDGTRTFWPLLILRKSDEVFCLLA